jgi:hypothetical protein
MCEPPIHRQCDVVRKSAAIAIAANVEHGAASVMPSDDGADSRVPKPKLRPERTTRVIRDATLSLRWAKPGHGKNILGT